MAKAKHSLARKADLKAGKTVWIVDDCGMRKVTIQRNEYTSHGDLKTFNLDGSWDMHADNAVIGLAYDDRPCQVFTNAKSAKWWHEYWQKAGIDNPNFVVKNPNNNQTLRVNDPSTAYYISSDMWY